MATIVQQLRGTTAQHAGYTGPAGSITVDTSKKTVVVHDGVTPGGNPLATAANTLQNNEPQTITVNNDAAPALTLNQLGNGDILRLNDVGGDTSPTVFDKDGRIIMGFSAAWEFIPDWVPYGIADSQFGIARFANNATGPSLALYKSRGTYGAGASVGNNDALGAVTFIGLDGVRGVVGAQIAAEVDGTPGAWDMPARLVFLTTPDGAAVPVERVRIDAAGNVGIGKVPVAGAGRLQVVDGVNFPSTQVDSANANTLDDYEEGTFTPTIVGGTAAGTATYTLQRGRYTKIGNRVCFYIAIAWTGHTGTGSMSVSGLPFAGYGGSNTLQQFAVTVVNIVFAGQVAAGLAASGTAISIVSQSSNADIAAVAVDAGGTIYISGQYEVA